MKRSSTNELMESINDQDLKRGLIPTLSSTVHHDDDGDMDINKSSKDDMSFVKSSAILETHGVRNVRLHNSVMTDSTPLTLNSMLT